MMRLKTGEINRCGYCMTVLAAGVREEVGPKEEALMGEIDESAFTRGEYLGIKLAEYVAGDPNYIPDEFYDELKEVYTEESDYEIEMAYPFVPKVAANG